MKTADAGDDSKSQLTLCEVQFTHNDQRKALISEAKRAGEETPTYQRALRVP